MKPKIINFIFSLLFLLLCSSVICLFQNKEIFNFKEHVILSTFICGLLIVTTFFNVLAWLLKNRCYYVFGAFGFLVFFLFQVVNITALILALMGYFHEAYMKERFIFFQFSNFNFPLSIFALSSTLYCYQKMYYQQMDENYRITFSKLMLVKFCPNDYIKCIKFFNYAILLTTFSFGAFTFQMTRNQFQLSHLILLLPLLTALFNLLAIKFKVKCFCIPVIVAWALFCIPLILGLCATAYDLILSGRLTFNSFIIGSCLFLTYAINVFICISTNLYIITHSNSHEYDVTNASNAINNCKYELESISTTTRSPRNQIEREESLKQTVNFIFQVNVKCRRCDND